MRATLELTVIYLPCVIVVMSGVRLPYRVKERLLYWVAERTDALAHRVHEHIAYELDSLGDSTA